MSNNRLLLFIAAIGILFLCSCATEKPVVVNFPIRTEPQGQPGSPPSQPSAEVQLPSQPSTQAAQAVGSPAPAPPAAGTQTAPEAKPAIAVPLTQFNTPDNTPEQPAPKNEKDLENLVVSNNTQFEIVPEQQDYHGGAVQYNYVPNHIYQVFCAPLELTTIILEPGESIVNAPAAGDTSNFMVATSFSVEEGQQRQQVLVKAVYPGKNTTMSVNTSKRSYFFHLISYDKIWMPLVSFSYPLELAEQMKRDSQESQNRVLLYNRISDLDFRYTIVPHSVSRPHWMPDRVFNDGRKTYISFPSASRASYAPVLFEVNSKGEHILVNYRVVSTYYIVDRVLMHFELVLDVNEGNIVTVVHTNED
jgi:type IV secretion system protein VirB9